MSRFDEFLDILGLVLKSKQNIAYYIDDIRGSVCKLCDKRLYELHTDECLWSRLYKIYYEIMGEK